MNKFIQEFKVYDWVAGGNSQPFLSISITPDTLTEPKDTSSLPEAQLRLKKLGQQYFEVLEQNKSLEEQLYNAQCQLRALQASNVISKDSIFQEELSHSDIEELSEQFTNLKDFNEDNQDLSKKVYFQQLIIDDLMCKLQNMHHRVEYYKDDVTELKSQYENEKKIVVIEKKNNVILDEQNSEAQKTIQKLKNDVEDLKVLLEEALNRRIVETKVVYEKSAVQIEMENEQAEAKFKGHLEFLKKQYSSEIFRIQQKNQILIEDLGLCMKKRIEELKNFYEYRIHTMINEYSFEEAKFSSTIIALKHEISEYMNAIHRMQQTVEVGEHNFLINKQKTNSAEVAIKNLQEIIENNSLELVSIRSSKNAEIEELKKHALFIEDDLKRFYDLELKRAQKNYEDSVDGLKAQYKMKLAKIDQEFKANQKKLKEKEKNEFSVLFDEISKIEREKTSIEMQTESRVQEVVREARSKYQEYEILLDDNKKKMLEQWNEDKKYMTLKHEHEIKELKEKFENSLNQKVEKMRNDYEGKIEYLNKSYDENVRTLKRVFADEIADLKEKHEKIMLELNAHISNLGEEIKEKEEIIDSNEKEKQEILQKHSQEILNEQKRYVELQLSYNEVRNLKQKMQDGYEEKLISLRHTLEEKEGFLKLKYETEKNLEISHIFQEKAELEQMYQKKIGDLYKKHEELQVKYNQAKQKRTVLRFSETNTQRFTQELHERDRLIEQLRREKNSLQTSLEYMNSTVRIFSSQEKTFHTKTNSFDSKTPKASAKVSRFNNALR